MQQPPPHPVKFTNFMNSRLSVLERFNVRYAPKMTLHWECLIAMLMRSDGGLVTKFKTLQRAPKL